jgi:hypothetical protein
LLAKTGGAGRHLIFHPRTNVIERYSLVSVLPDFNILRQLYEFGQWKGMAMKRIWRTLAAWLLVAALVTVPAIANAADFELFWDASCDAEADLEGYYIYYIENASVVDDPGGAIDVYVALEDIDFDPDSPSYLIPGLHDDVRYCFAVTAWYGDEESGMSNEVCGINGTYDTDLDPSSSKNPDPNYSESASSNSNLIGECFIGSLP